MKNYTIRFRIIDKQNFKDIQKKRKTIETRAGSERFRTVATGDTLTIVCGKERIIKTVKKAHHFKTLGATIKALPITKQCQTLKQNKKPVNSGTVILDIKNA